MKTILVVDDNPSIAELVKYCLDNYQIDAAKNGKVALTYLENKIPNLILLDLEMPEINGVQFRKQQLSNPRWKNIPTVLISGRDHPEDVVDEQEIALLPQERLPKPFGFNKLISVVERLSA
jgi:CheY-like chemotaxis protein